MNASLKPTLLVLAAAVAACSAPSASHAIPTIDPGRSMTSSTVAPEASNSVTTGNIVLQVPANAASAQSASIVAGTAAPVVQNLSASAPGCVAATPTKPLTCTTSISATAGTDRLVIKTYSAPNASGSVLASAAFLQAFSATSPTSVPVILGGTPATLSLALASTSPRECNPSTTIPLYVKATDSAGNVIVGPYSQTVSLNDSDTSGATALTASTLQASSSTIGAKYNGYALASATFRATASGVPNPGTATLTPLQMIYTAENPIYVFPANQNGTSAPARTIYMPASVQYSPQDVALTKTCMLYELDATNVVGWPAGTNGSVRPSVNITGSATRLNASVKYLAADAGGAIYVTNIGYTNGSFIPEVDVFSAGSNGDVAPARIISGSNTGLQDPWAIAVDSSGYVYVADNGVDKIFVYAPGANGNASPVRTIGGTNVLINGPEGIAVDGSGNVYLANYFGNRVDVYAPGVNGNVAPLRSLTVASPNGLAISLHNTLIVSTPSVPAVYTFSLTASGTATPLHTIRYATPSGVAI